MPMIQFSKLSAYNIMFKNVLARRLIYKQWVQYYKVKSQRRVELGIVHMIYLSWQVSSIS